MDFEKCADWWDQNIFPQIVSFAKEIGIEVDALADMQEEEIYLDFYRPAKEQGRGKLVYVPSLQEAISLDDLDVSIKDMIHRELKKLNHPGISLGMPNFEISQYCYSLAFSPLIMGWEYAMTVR